ncbi:Vitamin B12 import ATP-binding protein BtuD [Oligella sp. MSHR50489EDL]|uniref:ABC transporter permease subunit n=1 Tax=Oligella sp. MSHR50489EDL TaxID=3139409 RepID=UPI003D817854
MEALLIQLLNGLASTSSLFLAALGLTIIFGVCRVVNFAHGSFYMLGLYIAYSLSTTWGADSVLGFWGSIFAAAVMVGVLGALIEIFVLRRIYKAPELFQLLATFAILLIISDFALWQWGPEDLLGPKAPGLEGAVTILNRSFPEYDLLLIVLGPAILLAVWAILRFTRFGLYVRAATHDREMLAALGVNQAWLFTAVFALGSFIAALAAGFELPREPASLSIDLNLIGDVFAVVVIGGMGSIPGAFLAALLISEIKAICIFLGSQTIFGVTVEFSQLTLVMQFVLMALVLIFRPWGLLGKPQQSLPRALHSEPPLNPASRAYKVLALAIFVILATFPSLEQQWPYLMLIMQDGLMMMLFAGSLYFIAGPAGMVSFGHAAYFGVGAYTAALLATQLAWPMWVVMLVSPLGGLMAAVIFGWFSVRLTGIYMAMLTLAFAQFIWSVIFQWDGFTGGSNGLIGIWPEGVLAEPGNFYYFTLVVVALSLVIIRQLIFTPFGYAMRATRDAPLRAQAIGIKIKRIQWQAFIVAGFFAGISGVLFVYAKGSISPDELSVGRSVDGLVMVLLGGIQAISGPVVGAVTYVVLHDWVSLFSEYWKALLGGIILFLVLLLPGGLVSIKNRFAFTSKALSPLATKSLQSVAATPSEAMPDIAPATIKVGSEEVILSVKDISKRYGAFWAVNDTSFDIKRGEMLALIGPNGAGKSTIFNMVGGQFEPTGGEISFKGQSLKGLDAAGIWSKGIGRTFQIATVFNSMTVLENMQVALHQSRSQGFDNLSDAADMLAQVGLEGVANRLAGELAYGDVKRLELAMALAHRPELLLMDEPTAGMAAGERHLLMKLVKSLSAERQMAVLFTEHSVDVVFNYADRILVLAEGTLITEGTAASIAQDEQVRTIYMGSSLLNGEGEA